MVWWGGVMPLGRQGWHALSWHSLPSWCTAGAQRTRAGTGVVLTYTAPGRTASLAAPTSATLSSASPYPIRSPHSCLLRLSPPPPCPRLLDTLPLARACVADCANHRQGTLRERFRLALPPGEQEHDAGTDATVLARLLPHLVRASGARRLADIVEGRVRKKSGESFTRTFAHVQDHMRGAAEEEAAAEAEVFTCPFCFARIVE